MVKCDLVSNSLGNQYCAHDGTKAQLFEVGHILERCIIFIVFQMSMKIYKELNKQVNEWYSKNV